MKITKTIRDLESELYQQARAEALRQGKTIGQWVNEAIFYYLTVSNIEKKQGK